MSDPVMESLEILGTPEFSNLWRVDGDVGEIDEKVVKKDETLWTIMNNYEKRWKTMKTMQDNKKLWKKDKELWRSDITNEKWWKTMKKWWQMVKDDDKRWKMMNNDEKQWKWMKNDEKVMKINQKWWKVIKNYENER